MHANVGNGEEPAVNGDHPTTNARLDTDLKKALEGLSSVDIRIEPSSEEREDGADDELGTRSVPSDDGDDLQLNGDKPNVCFSHLPLSP